MRERLTLAFILVVVSILTIAFVVRNFIFSGNLREQLSTSLSDNAVALAAVADQRSAAGAGVDEATFAGLVPDDVRLEFTPDSGAPFVVDGVDYSVDGDGLTAAADAADGTLELSQSGAAVSRTVRGDVGSLLLLLLLLGAIAGATGFLVSRSLSRPFRRLATAAGALGRGRFDLDLPQSRLPEARAITRALASAADRLESQLTREQEFSEHASHVLRTPLTGLRFELEDLGLRGELDDDARRTVDRCIQQVDVVVAVADQLVQISRTSSLAAGSELSLRDLATQSAQRWADELADHDRPLTAAVDGDIETTYTPGPVEQILDLLLIDVLQRGDGAVRLEFDADVAGHLRIRVRCAAESRARGRGDPAGDPLARATAVVLTLGGRFDGDSPMGGYTVLLPRR